MKTIRRSFIAAGQVQGVGLRPFVFRLAREEKLTGFVGNTSEGVRIEVQGDGARVARFESRLLAEAPPLARIVALRGRDMPFLPEEKNFIIRRSSVHAGHSVLVSPDMGICADCRMEMRDPANRRFAYPFTNCTNCGPRYSIMRAIPYDRASTTMGCFPLCPACAAEYANPADRRFHAQPVACPVCGPHLWFVRAASPDSAPTAANRRDALARSCRVLLSGGILALKGLGGFQLACNARDGASVSELRRRKQRPHKPLALMAGDIAVARTLCLLTPEHEALLQSPESPVVLCPRREGCPLPGDVAPDVNSLGLMLPCTPLHAAIFDHLSGLAPSPPVLVMTSANPRGEPICLGNREALSRIAGMADAFLLHDRDILTRVDDSVIALAPVAPEGGSRIPSPPEDGSPERLFFRRARGYVPYPVSLPQDGPVVLGAGAELKSTVCLTRGNQAFVGQHVGDLENPATLNFYEEVVARLETLLEIRPKAIVCDLHPDFLACRYAHARAVAEGLPFWRLQHHAAHAAAVLAENNCYDPALALCLDGSGLGDDGGIWGGEAILMDISRARWQRVGRLSPFPLPGGDAAIREPWRCALALREQCGSSRENAAAPWDGEYAHAASAVREMLGRNLNCPQTSSCGRLFDAVAAQLGLCLVASYEGQAAMRLESAADTGLVADFVARGADTDFRWALPLIERDGLLNLDSAHLFARVLEARREGEPVGVIAARFHTSLARGFADMAARAASTANVGKVGLSGGVMQNGIMALLLPFCLRQRGLEPLVHHALPPGDGGLSLGQAVWGRRMLHDEH
ncbi:MAG: carbamoyltransferase HypF [Desulfovibrio sp.]|jgi:hydrogenase maturation protein HypF|nr:carbamoyltransferase HypF [Desulfovibrio sp.]